jgi:exodeoxyribonuclease VII large subunit
MQDVLLQPSEFVALINQTLEFALPYVVVEGELANLRVSKNKWVYFDIKDEAASVKCFGTVYQLPGPLENGMLIKVAGNPRLHQQFGFSLNVQSIQPSGEGSIKKAAHLLEQKLKAEGLFAASRKRPLPYPPEKIGLIASGESAAYSDFIKILNTRWHGIEVLHKDVQVQGDPAVGDIVKAIELFNTHPEYAVDVVVVTRGGGSADDLAAFSSEQVTRAVAGSRIPTLVAIGHERDISLAELAADMRASTPSNAAELLVPDRSEQSHYLQLVQERTANALRSVVSQAVRDTKQYQMQLNSALRGIVALQSQQLAQKKLLLAAYNPANVLERGYAVVRKDGRAVRTAESVKPQDNIDILLADGSFVATRIKE